MKKTLLKILNPILAIVFIVQAGTGIFHDYIPYELFQKMHKLAGLFLIICIIAHIILNWNWIKATFFGKA